MTTEIEKQFFEAFGIKPATYAVWDSTETKMKNFESWDEYPQITDRILLELICILSKAYSHKIYGYPLTSKDTEELKEDVLDALMGAIDVYNDYPDGYADKVQALFKEG